jgi:hypothetical protein
MTASGVPNDNGRFVTIMKTGPRFLRVCSLAASDAEVDDAGYSPKALVRYWVFQTNLDELTPYSKPNDSPSYSHHPEHTNKCISLLIIEVWTVDVTRW